MFIVLTHMDDSKIAFPVEAIGYLKQMDIGTAIYIGSGERGYFFVKDAWSDIIDRLQKMGEYFGDEDV